MAKYIISGLPTHFVASNGKIAELNTLAIEARLTVDVSSMAELQAAFDAHCGSLTGKGKQCYRMDVAPFQGVRAFPGFKKASKKDGLLNRVINKNEAIQHLIDKLGAGVVDTGETTA